MIVESGTHTLNAELLSGMLGNITHLTITKIAIYYEATLVMGDYRNGTHNLIDVVVENQNNDAYFSGFANLASQFQYNRVQFLGSDDEPLINLIITTLTEQVIDFQFLLKMTGKSGVVTVLGV